MVKVLLITGVHGSELYGDIVARKLKKNFLSDEIEIEVIGPINNQFDRNVSFNLNRIDQIEELHKQAETMKNLLEKGKEYDIILDIHNTQICSNVLLHSSSTDRNYKIPSSENNLPNNPMIIWRESKFDTISEYFRKLGKISYTVEIGSMHFIDPIKLDRDYKFLDNCVIFCYRQLNDKESKHDLFTEYNKLRVIKLKKKQWLTQDDYIYFEDVETIDDIPTKEFFENNKLTTSKARVISISTNYDDLIEAIILPY